MKFPLRSACFVLVCSLAFLVVSMPGCTNKDPTVQADQNRLDDDNGALSSLQQQISDLKKQLAASTQPADATAINGKIAALQAQVDAQQKKVNDDTTQLAADVDAVKKQQIQTASNVVGQAGAVAAVAAPQPVGAIIGAVAAIVAGVLGVFATKQTSALQTAQSVITAAAPGVAQLVKQSTDNQQLATDVTHIAQVAPGVLALLAHPSASSVLKATGVTATTLSDVKS